MPFLTRDYLKVPARSSTAPYLRSEALLFVEMCGLCAPLLPGLRVYSPVALHIFFTLNRGCPYRFPRRLTSETHSLELDVPRMLPALFPYLRSFECRHPQDKAAKVTCVFDKQYRSAMSLRSARSVTGIDPDAIGLYS